MTITSGWWRDAALGAALAAAAALAIGLTMPDPSPLAFGLVGLIAAPVAFRRRWPFSMTAVSLTASIAYHASDFPHEAALPPLMVMLYSLALIAGSRRATLMIGGFVAGLMIIATIQGGPDLGETIAVLGWLGLALAAAEATRNHRQNTELVEAEAIKAAIAREEQARRQVAEERMRIARDLHDVLAHNVSVINVQAAVATHLAGPADTDLAVAMGHIADASRQAVAELRATLGVLRGDGNGDPDAESRLPAPGLDRLDGLLESARAGGAQVEVQYEGGQHALPPPQDVTAYRILQEALTNVVKHAPGQRATLCITQREEEVVLTVANGGPSPPGTVEWGYGLRGMTERAHALGGELTVRQPVGGGFEVTATLPVPAAG